MGIDIVKGSATNPAAARELGNAILELGLAHGTLYIGYPLVASANGPAAIDALLCSEVYGLVAFDMSAQDTGEAEERRLEIDLAIRSRLQMNRSLVDKKTRDLLIKPKVFSYSPGCESVAEGEITGYTLKDTLERTCSSISKPLLRALESSIQSLSSLPQGLRRAKRAPSGSRKEVLQQIQAEIANLDRWQKRAAIESPEGPQRIRGIAGSGKTIVLALKAAYLHATNPDWKIAVTFYTRSLYQQFKALILKFHFEQARMEPDWQALRVIHAWGGRSTEGLYSQIAKSHGVPPMEFLVARRLDSNMPFQGACDDLEKQLSEMRLKEEYDAILVDEAQDLPASFLRLCYSALRNPKRLVWAYDELQNLNETQMPSLEEIFGTDPDGNPAVQLDSADRPDDEAEWASPDIILPVCYRNTPWALAAAHAVGFGIFRDGGLVQHFDEPKLWNHIGYRCDSGKLEAGKRVVLQRKQSCTPQFFQKLLLPDDAITWRCFSSREEEQNWLANAIRINLEDDYLDPTDILVVIPQPKSIEQKVDTLRRTLSEMNIASHIAGVGSSVDELFVQDSVAISGIYRAKGNEAPMVYVSYADECIARARLFAASRRNALFTAMTRSRTWLRLTGCGSGMEALELELQLVQSRGYRLDFEIPTQEELKLLKRTFRDFSSRDQQRVDSILERAIPELLQAMQDGDILPEDLPKELRDAVSRDMNAARRKKKKR